MKKAIVVICLSCLLFTRTIFANDEIHTCIEMNSEFDVIDSEDNSKTAEVKGYKLLSTAFTSILWKPGDTITIKFLDGSDFVKNKVKENALIWTKYANINFKFIESGNANIRISFSKPGSWSFMGKSVLQFKNQTTPTMNFGWFNDKTSDKEFRRTTLHEFGHALGLIHEHQHPQGGIPWNKEAVYEYYKKTNNWDKNTVDGNIFRKLDKKQTQYSSFDKESIMIYPIPKELTNGKFEVGLNTDLSATDIEFIKKIYPFKENKYEGMKKINWNKYNFSFYIPNNMIKNEKFNTSVYSANDGKMFIYIYSWKDKTVNMQNMDEIIIKRIKSWEWAKSVESKKKEKELNWNGFKGSQFFGTIITDKNISVKYSVIGLINSKSLSNCFAIIYWNSDVKIDKSYYETAAKILTSFKIK